MSSKDQQATGDDGKEVSIHRRVHFWSCAAFLLLMPVYQKALPPLALLLGVNGLTGILRKDPFFSAPWWERIQGPFSLFLLAFFLLHLLGVGYSEDQGHGLFEVQKKLGFLIFPLLFAFSEPFREREFRGLLKAFLAGALLATIMGIGNALDHFYPSMDPYLLYGERFAVGIHRGYLALFLLMGILILLHFLMEKGSKRKRSLFLYGSALLLLLIGLFLAGSRSALLALPFLVFFYIGRSLPLSFWKRSFLFGCLALLMVGGLFLFPRNLDRMEKAVRPFTTPKDEWEGKVDQRVRVWPAAFGIFKENWVFGVGTGDVPSHLMEAYQRAGLEKPVERNFNAHDQFLQTGIAIGIPGILLLFLILGRLLLKGWQRPDLLLFGIGVLFLFSAAFESSLERQAGILFFTFFIPLLEMGRPG